MKISRLLQVVFVGSNLLLAVPALASEPARGADQPLSLCGGEKGEKAEKGDKKSDGKKETTKDDKRGEKEPATT